jgi:hypothetical protein
MVPMVSTEHVRLRLFLRLFHTLRFFWRQKSTSGDTWSRTMAKTDAIARMEELFSSSEDRVLMAQKVSTPSQQNDDFHKVFENGIPYTDDDVKMGGKAQ